MKSPPGDKAVTNSFRNMSALPPSGLKSGTVNRCHVPEMLPTITSLESPTKERYCESAIVSLSWVLPTKLACSP